MPKVIVTGGTGLVGRQLCRQLEARGYKPAVLTRDPKKPNEYQWDIDKQTIDPKVLDGAIAIIHLAGTPVADKPWTPGRKRDILDSRARSAALLYDTLRQHPHTIRTFISASAVGWYGDGGDAWQTEDMPSGKDFLAEVCRNWEASADRFGELGLRVAKLRIGIVLSRAGGALPQMDLPAKFGVGAYFGDGRQYMPWIHIDDLCRLFLFALETETLRGPVNACGPKPLPNREFMRTLATALKRPFIPVPAPAFALKAALGERAQLLLFSNRCSAEKALQAGFSFLYPTADAALRQLYQK